MLTCESRRPLSRAPLDFTVQHRANGDFNVIEADRCEGCPTPAHCAVEGCGSYCGTFEAADARLIAAAPELMEALERCLSWLTSYPGGGTMGPKGPYEQARAAIARATGANDGR